MFAFMVLKRVLQLGSLLLIGATCSFLEAHVLVYVHYLHRTFFFFFSLLRENVLLELECQPSSVVTHCKGYYLFQSILVYSNESSTIYTLLYQR